MSSRIRVTLMVVGGIIAPLIQAGPAAAREGYWQGDISNDWGTASNWWVEGAGGDGGLVPQSGGGFNIRAIIGTDSPNGALNSFDAPFGSPVISGALPAAKQSIGGLYFGLRELNYGVSPPVFVNPAPDPGALVGALTITAGTLNNVATTESGIGADGRIMVGVDGRGYLTMTGGSLTGQALVVGGENMTTDAGTPDELGPSLVDLSGSATLTISNPTPSSGVATFNRRLRIEGPGVNFSATGTIRLNSTNTYTAVITSSTAHSPLQGGSSVIVGGALNVEFSGAGATHALGQTWDLVDATTGLAGDFNNLGLGGDVNVTGLASPPPVGAVYRLRRADGPSDHKLLQLVYDRVLVLHVDRDTGEVSITNPLGGAIDIDGYTVSSSLRSLLDTYKGISGAPEGDTGWAKYGLSQNTLTELKQVGSLDLTSVPSLTLGTGFDQLAVAGDVANFGTDGEDLIFEYTSPFGGVIRGQVEYEGTKFENNLVLRVNPTSGQATLKNDSLETLTFDGYAILSSTSDLDGTGWTGLGGTWDQSPASSSSLTETNLFGSLTLDPGEEEGIGDISASGFTSEAAQAGLNMQFILSESLVSGPPGGDYNDDGTVDAADYTVWRDNFGQTFTLLNENPDATTPGVVDDEDYDFWKAQFGATGSVLPETAFRIGSVVFDATLGAGSGSLAVTAAVPEPGTGLLLLTGLGAALALRRGRQRQRAEAAATGGAFRPLGVRTMSRPFGFCLAAALAFCVALLTSMPATATTQGIALTNGDFELPGPVNDKTIAFDEVGDPIAGIIPGWTFPGPGVEDFGHEDHEGGDALGDSGTEGGGNPGNEMLLSTWDGIAYQTSSFSVVSIPTTQVYRLSFDAHDIYTIDADNQLFDEPQNQLEARLYYLAVDGTTRTTIGSPLVISGLPTDVANYTMDIVGGSPALTPALGRPIGVEFDVTSDEYNALVAHSWGGIDNVLIQITGVLPGDLDGDGDVDTVDYAIVRDHQQQSQLYNAQGELTGDAFVDLDDFRAFKSLYAAGAGSGSGSGSLASGTVPEPSTLVLALMFVAAVAWAKRRRFMAMSLRLAIMAVAASAVAVAPASADVLYYDPFLVGPSPAAGEYTVGLLTGQDPTTGPTPFFDGAWAERPGGADDASNGQVKPPPGLSFLGAPADGGSAGPVQDPETFETNTRVGRYIPSGTRWTNSKTGTYYISWIQNFGTIPGGVGDMGFRATEFWSATGTVGVDTTAVGYIGYNSYYSALPEPVGSQQKAPATARMTFAWGEPQGHTHTIIENSPISFNEDGATHLIVLKFVLSDVADSDSVSVFLDPITLTEPDLPGASLSGIDITLGAMGFSLFGGAGAILPTFDELRVADTWIDAVVEFPLPGDTDNDGDVDLDDYNNIVSHMNQQVSSALEGDVALANGTQGSDGRVTLGDYRLWKDNYPTPPPGSGALADLAVPEPASWLLMLVAAATCAILGRRRR